MDEDFDGLMSRLGRLSKEERERVKNILLATNQPGEITERRLSKSKRTLIVRKEKLLSDAELEKQALTMEKIKTLFQSGVQVFVEPIPFQIPRGKQKLPDKICLVTNVSKKRFAVDEGNTVQYPYKWRLAAAPSGTARSNWFYFEPTPGNLIVDGFQLKL